MILQETKLEVVARSIIKSLCGRSGGILVTWDDRIISALEVVCGCFSVSVKFRCADNVEWWAYGIYGPNNPRGRKEFWDKLYSLFGLRSPKWVLGGDFNVVRLVAEKLYGVRITRSMRDFDAFIRDCSLRDIPLSNTRFTWSNMQENLVCSRLDRFLFSLEWEELFPNVRQLASPRVTSDHCPVLLDSELFSWGPSPFRFENMWLEHHLFRKCFEEWWKNCDVHGREGFKFMWKLKLIEQNIKDWNMNVFGDTRIVKSSISRRIVELDHLEVDGIISEG